MKLMSELIDSLSNILGVSSFVLLAIYLLSKYGNKTSRLRNKLRLAEQELQNKFEPSITDSEDSYIPENSNYIDRLNEEILLARKEYQRMLTKQLRGERTYHKTYHLNPFSVASTAIIVIISSFAAYFYTKDITISVALSVFSIPVILIFVVLSYSFQTVFASYISSFVYISIFFIQPDANHTSIDCCAAKQSANCVYDGSDSSKAIILAILLALLVYYFANFVDKNLNVLRETIGDNPFSIFMKKQSEQRCRNFFIYTCNSTFLISVYILVYSESKMPTVWAVAISLIGIDLIVFLVIGILLTCEFIAQVDHRDKSPCNSESCNSDDE